MLPPLSIRVSEVIVQAGGGNVETLRKHFPHLSGRDLMKALQSAGARGYIRVGRKGRGPSDHPTQWLPGRVPLVKPPKVSSVFELGTPRPETAWPSGWIGTVHRPLGEWNTEQEAA